MSAAPSSALLTSLDASLVARVLSLNPRCRRLNLSSHAISQLEGGDALQPLQELLALNLSRNALRSIGAEFSHFANLRVLDLSFNHL
jgi:Leucine-rich repeat (LRR) protein